MVSRQNMDRHTEPLQRLLHELVLGHRTIFGEIARDQDRVGFHVQLPDGCDRGPEADDRVALGPDRSDVRVGELDENGRLHHHLEHCQAGGDRCVGRVAEFALPGDRRDEVFAVECL